MLDGSGQRETYRKLLQGTRTLRKHWRRARPPWLAIVMYLVFVIAAAISARVERHATPLESIWKIFAGFALATCFVAGILRFMLRDPASRPSYASWLAQTPWTPDKPLLLGSPFFEVRDALWFVPMLALAFTISGSFAIWTAVTLLAGYLVAAMTTIPRFAPRVIAYVITFVSSFALVAPQEPRIVASALAVALIPAAFGIKGSLESFPWHLDPLLVTRAGNYSYRGITLATPLTTASEQERPVSFASVGWPWAALTRVLKITPSWGHACATGVLVAWLACLAFRLLDQHATEDRYFMAVMVAFVLVLVLSLGRLVIYLSACRAPISFCGRIWNLRLVVPRFDVVFAGTGLAWVFAACALITYHNIILRAAFCGVVAAVLVGTPPSVRTWMLTGHYRAIPPVRNPATPLIRIG